MKRYFYFTLQAKMENTYMFFSYAISTNDNSFPSRTIIQLNATNSFVSQMNLSKEESEKLYIAIVDFKEMNEKDFNQYLEIDFLEDNFKQEFSTKKADT
jgi:hypothetical protein